MLFGGRGGGGCGRRASHARPAGSGVRAVPAGGPRRALTASGTDRAARLEGRAGLGGRETATCARPCARSPGWWWLGPARESLLCAAASDGVSLLLSPFES